VGVGRRSWEKRRRSCSTALILGGEKWRMNNSYVVTPFGVYILDSF